MMARMIMAGIMIMGLAGSINAGWLWYDATNYGISASAHGSIDDLEIYPANFTHISAGEYVVHFNDDSYDVSSAFSIDADVVAVGNVITSQISRRQMAIAFKTTCAPSNYYEQEITLVNRTNIPLNNCVLYRLQDADLFDRSRDNTVARDEATHALYQYQYCLFIAQNMYWPDMTPAGRWYGGNVDHLWDMMYEHPPSNGIAQANDSAVLHGIEIGTLQPGQATTVIVRVAFGTSQAELSEYALPVSFYPEVSKLAFSINTTAQNADGLGMTLLFDPAVAGITTLQGRLLSLYVSDCAILDRVAGTVKVSPKGDSAVYQSGGATVSLKLSLAKNTAVMKVKMKGGALRPGLGTFVDGQSGAVYPHVRLYFDAPGQSGIGTAFVPYKAKPGKGFAGKQWK